MVTHSTSLVRLSDYVATLVGGHVTRVQTSREFLTRHSQLPERPAIGVGA
jgi:hypothetical protein